MGKKFLLTLITVLFLIIIKTYGQKEIIAISDDEDYIAISEKEKRIKDTIFLKTTAGNYIKKEEYLNEIAIKIYQLSPNKFIQKIYLKSKEAILIEEGGFNSTKKIFYLKNNGQYHFWNIILGQKTKSIYADSIITGNFANFYISIRGDEIYKNSYYYNKKTKIDIPRGEINKIGLTSDDKFLIVSLKNKKINIWETKNPSKRKKLLIGDDFTVDEKGGFYINKFYRNSNSIIYYKYDEQQQKIDKKRVIGSNRFIEDGKIFKGNLVHEKSNFSPFGKTFKYTWKKGLRTHYTIINLENEKEIFDTKDKNKIQWRQSPEILSEKKIAYKENRKTLKVLNTKTGKQTEKIEEYKKKDFDDLIVDDKVYIVKEDEDSILFYNNSEKRKITNKKMLEVKNSDKYIFFKDKKDSLEYIYTNKIIDTNYKQKFEKPRILKKKSKKENFPNENKLKTYLKTNEFREISSNADSSIHLVAKSISINEDFTSLQFYLIDDQNNYYYNLSSEQWQHLICNIQIKDEYGNIYDIEDYRLKEYSDKNKTPIAICYVLDHSGSMGSDNSKLMQENLIKLINKKKNLEAVSIIKFDDKVEKTTDLTRSTSKILKYFGIEGLNEFGGSTALLDGINTGLDVLINTDRFENKALIVLTDGNENASKSTHNEVLLKAVENNIGIYSIGFGDDIDEDFLKSISTNTSGAFYQIDKSEGFSDVFNDIYKNMKNFYSIEFSTPYPGKFKIIVELCYGKHDSLTYYFDNYIPNILYTNNISEHDSLYKELTGLDDTVYSDNFNTKKIYEDIKYNELKNEFDTLIFPDIKFYFDQTRIVEGTDKELVNVIEFMKNNSDTKIEIQGHTDGKGSHAYNEKLSQARANKVKKIMVDAGIKSERIRTVGFGKRKPIATNVTDEGRQENRRVEFVLLK